MTAATQEKRQTWKGVGCLILFGLPFAAGGTFVGWLALSQVWSSWQALGWQEVPARILEADLEVSRGDDSTTYRVTAAYEYIYQGETHRSDRVGFGFGSDNVGSFHQDAYRELAAHRDADRPFPAWVDPDEPSRSVLYRGLRWGMLLFQTVFALAFGLVGYGLMAVGVWGGRKVAAEERLQTHNPTEPWRWKEEWATGRVPAGARGRMFGAIAFAVLWNLISAPVLLFVPDEIAAGNWLPALALVFPLVGVGLLSWAAVETLRWRRYGRSFLELSTVPGVLGGHLEGRIDCALRASPDDRVKLTLSCIHVEVTGSGKNRSRRERVLWQDDRTVGAGSLGLGPRGAMIPVEFAIPFDAGPPSSTDDDDRDVHWRLTADADVPGVDYSVSFDVPVFRTDRSDPELTDEALASTPDDTGPATAPVHLEALGIHVHLLADGGRRIELDRARHRGATLGLTLWNVIWVGAIVLMVRLDAPILFPIVFGVFAALTLYAMLEMWIARRWVTADATGLTFSSGFLALSTRHVPRDEIDRIGLDRGMQAGAKLYHQVVVETPGGKKHLLLDQLPDRRLARRLVGELEAGLGRERSSEDPGW